MLRNVLLEYAGKHVDIIIDCPVMPGAIWIVSLGRNYKRAHSNFKSSHIDTCILVTRKKYVKWQ